MSKTPDLEAMSKEELEEFASVRGIRLDKRLAKDKMVAVILDEMTAPVVIEERQAASRDTNPLGDAGMHVPVAPIDEKKAAAADKAMPDERLQELAFTWASSFANGLERVNAQRIGNDLIVTMKTVHGDSRGAAGDVTWSEAGVNSALDEIKKQMI